MGNRNTAIQFLRDKGFYIALAVCIVGAAGAAWATASRTLDSIEENNRQIVEQGISGEEKPSWSSSSTASAPSVPEKPKEEADQTRKDTGNIEKPPAVFAFFARGNYLNGGALKRAFYKPAVNTVNVCIGDDKHLSVYFWRELFKRSRAATDNAAHARGFENNLPHSSSPYLLITSSILSPPSLAATTSESANAVTLSAIISAAQTAATSLRSAAARTGFFVI